MNDWKGNRRSAFAALGAASPATEERERHDYYATHPSAAEWLLRLETFDRRIWECACGEKHLSRVLERHGHEVRSSDLIDRCGCEVFDFLGAGNTRWDGDIITNPPYRYALEFVRKALSIIPDGHKAAMFLKLQFLESRERKSFFLASPPRAVYVSSGRILCAKNGDFGRYTSSAVAYAWYVWQKGYSGEPVIRWFN